MPPDHFWHGPSDGPFWSPFGHFLAFDLSALLWLLLLGGIIWAVLHLMRRVQPAQAPSSSAEPSALEILRRRYALGQIDHAAFEEMTSHLLASEERDQPPIQSA